MLKFCKLEAILLQHLELINFIYKCVHHSQHQLSKIVPVKNKISRLVSYLTSDICFVNRNMPDNIESIKLSIYN